MCKKLFIAATGQHCGKTTISLSLMHLALKQYARVGYIKPLGPKCQDFNGTIVDKDAALMARVFGQEERIALMSPLVLGKGATRRFLDGEQTREWAAEQIQNACHELESQCDLILIEGAGHSGVGSVIGLNNADMARMLGAPVVMVAGGGIGNVIDSVRMNLALYQQEGVDVKLLLVNKMLPDKRQSSLAYLEKYFAPNGIMVSGAFDYSAVLADPTLQNLSKLLDKPLQGDQGKRQRIIHHIHLGAASSQKVIDNLKDSTLLLTTSSRDELLVTLSSLYNIPAFQSKIAGIVIPGHAPVSAITQRIIDDSGIPYIRIEKTTAEVYSALTDHISKISHEDTEKISLVTSQAEQVIDFEAIKSIL
ncbi:phosphotransacetylase family protein [Trichlorobacter lovleyi]|uniref:BioD-like protein N-terminal domain of phosphotransacetylase-like protein n=1 Tax=Trichlorobacter lovleyi (strain ATCC BAA-1151 / DSM 17278 / SZ) TaxID=398767 RepID=B3E924_TRIL1|nr:AAA family ATPase [Trichlorobacter lovleyi]ACD96737.1 BioD-like protein N-terminal domain of phosphotransacetylase-like protein [Trichlorobacter lovleyi SZ]